MPDGGGGRNGHCSVRALLERGFPVELSNKTARQMYEELKAGPRRARYGFGRKAALINVDMQKAYTAVGEFPGAYETDPNQCDYVNTISDLARSKGLPVVWTYVAYMESGEDCGVWGTRGGVTQNGLAGIKVGSERAKLDPRLHVDDVRDIIVNKRMASAFHETNLTSLFTFHGIDTVIVSGGSTSGCVRATVVDSLSHSYRTIVPEETVADRHESPHFANLYDIAAKYADVVPVSEVIAYLTAYWPANER